MWLGLPYDAFNFSMYSAYIALALKSMHGIEVDLGTFTLQSGNEHLYDSNIEKTEDIFNGYNIIGYDDFDISYFNSHDELLTYLFNAKDKQCPLDAPFHNIITGDFKGERKDNWYDE